MSVLYENPEMLRMFKTYSDTKAPGRNSIADHLAVASLEEHREDVLIVVTGTDIAIYPGKGADPEVQGLRVNIPGFTELTAVSHFGPAVGSIVALKERGIESWRGHAERLLDDARRVRAENSATLWADSIAVEVLAGREDAIAAMTDYACMISERYLARSLEDPDYMTPLSLREDYLAGTGQPELPVGCNRIMIATFSLVALELGHRLIQWVERLELDWAHVLFAIAGRQGRPTGGTTKKTTSLARIINIVSRGELNESRVFIAPHLPVFAHPVDGDLREVIDLEEPVRWQLARVMSSVELAPIMFEGLPVFLPEPLYDDDLPEKATTATDMPRIRSADDWLSMLTRLRLSLEDSRQLLASGVTDFIVQQLMDAGNDPRRVTIPGLDGEPYPGMPNSRR